MAAFVILWLVGLTFWHHFKLAFQFCVMGEYVKSPASINCIVTPDPLQDWLTRIRQIQRHSFAFIYSDQDDLIPGKKVEQTAEVLKKRGNYVTMVKFEGSEHVQHYRAYPQVIVKRNLYGHRLRLKLTLTITFFLLCRNISMQ